MERSILFVIITTFVALVLMFIAVAELSKTVSTYVETLPQICSDFPPTDRVVGCLEFLQTCQPDYYRHHIDTGNNMDSFMRKYVLGKGKLAIQPDGRSYHSCSIPVTEFTELELGWSLGCRGFEEGKYDEFRPYFVSKEVGCMVPFGSENTEKVDAIPGVHVAGPGLKKTVYTDALSDLGKSTFMRMYRGKQSPTYAYPTLARNPTLPSKEEFPELVNILDQYQDYYNKKWDIFRVALTRCGYILGNVYMTPDLKPIPGGGRVEMTPIVQKKFDGKYFSLLYRYTSEAFNTFECNNLSDWFIVDDDPSKPSSKMELMADPNVQFSHLDDFLTDKIKQYRNRYLMDVFRINHVKFTIIIEVGNQYHKDPIFTVGFTKFWMDTYNHVLWFDQKRLIERYTSNKKVFNQRYDYPLCSINCGTEHAWTMGYANYGVDCKNHTVFMTIPTGKTCPWQQWFRGNIVISNDEAINIAGPISDFDKFKKDNLGQWMHIWISADNGDPFQEIQMSPGILNFNPYMFKEAFVRKEGQTDESWALFIWKTISGEGDTAHYNETYKELIDKVKGKNILDFKDYVSTCVTSLQSLQFIKPARSMGCLGPVPKPKKPDAE